MVKEYKRIRTIVIEKSQRKGNKNHDTFTNKALGTEKSRLNYMSI